MNTLLVSSAVLANDFDLDTDTVTPGVLGFLAIFAIGLALYFLMRSLFVKLRGVSSRADEAEAAEAAEAEAAEKAQAGEKDGGDEASGVDAADTAKAEDTSVEDTSAKS